MDRIVNKIIRFLKKKYVFVTFIFVFLLIIIGSTYSYWSYEADWRQASEIKFKELLFSLQVADQNTTIAVAPANSGTTFYNVRVTSLNELNTRYLLAYKASGVSVKVSSKSLNNSNGIIGIYSNGNAEENSKLVRIAITNDSDEDVTVNFSVFGGYTWNNANTIAVDNEYTEISEIYEEESTLGLLFSEEINVILNCTPTSTSPCLMRENSNNYVTYSNKTWRIIGTYLINGEYITKLILDEPLEVPENYANANTMLTTFYNILNKSIIREASPFECTGSTDITCTGNANIGHLSKSEYDLIGGVNSYLYTKPNKEYWTNTSSGTDEYYVGTSRGIGQFASSSTAYIRPTIYLKSNAVRGYYGNGLNTNPYQVSLGRELTINTNFGTSSLNSGIYGEGLEYPLVVTRAGGFDLYDRQLTGANSSINGNTLTMGTEDTTITYLWSKGVSEGDPVSYLTVNLNGGTQEGYLQGNTYYKQGSTISLNNMSKIGYTFNGWTILGDGASIDEEGILTAGTTDMTLTANWLRNQLAGNTQETVVAEYDYTGQYKTFTPTENGKYKIELWGAQGGSLNGGTPAAAGKGAYTSGEIELTTSDTLYFYVGQGKVTGGGATSFNGGTGTGGANPGGGATDVRLVNTAALTTWKDTASFYSRIMVAAGGGSTSSPVGGHAGGLKGYNGIAVSTQTSAGTGGYGNGGFGFGGGGFGGGGGYWGGGGIASPGPGGGGSSYISGHTGCVAMTAGTTTARTGTGGASCVTETTDNLCSVHYSNKIFENTLMIDGAGYTWTNTKASTAGTNLMPNPAGGTFATGNEGNGYARVTMLPDGSWITSGQSHSITAINLNGGTLSNLNYYIGGDYIEGARYSLPNPTKENETFSGWVITGTGTVIEDEVLTFGTTDITLTAIWEEPFTKKSFTYTVNGNPGVEGVDYEFIQDDSDNWRLKFYTSGIFTPLASKLIDAFAVGGGGGGGCYPNSSYFTYGGGGGGYTATSETPIRLNITDDYAITIGAGGTAGTSSDSSGKVGGITTGFGLTANGGAGGKYGSGGSGGSGGGAPNYAGGAYGNAGGGGATGQFSTLGSTCEFGEGTLSGCTLGDAYAYSGGGGGYNLQLGGAGGGGAGGSSGTNHTGGGAGSCGIGGTGVIVIRNTRN